MAKLKLKLTRRNPENLVTLGKLVHPKVAPPAPNVPPVPGVTTEAAALLTATQEADAANADWAAAKVTLDTLAQVRRDKADALRAAHDNLATALELKSQGNPAQLTATGYELAEVPVASTTPPDKILNLNLTAGDDDATLDAICDPDPKAGSIEWEVTTVHPVTGPYVKWDTTTASKTTLKDLVSGTRVWVRARGIGSKGPGPWSDPATKIVP